jgi:hypothetical protein
LRNEGCEMRLEGLGVEPVNLGFLNVHFRI